MLFSIFVPFVQRVEALEGDSITILPAISTEKGIQLQWQTNTTSFDEETFIVERNNEELSVQTIEEIESTADQKNQTVRTYQFLDTDVVQGEEYTYLVKKTGKSPLQTEPHKITFKQDVNTLQELTLTVTNTTEKSLTVSWRDIQDVDVYQLIVNGKMIESFDKATTYEVDGLTSGTSYSVSIRAIKDENIVTEASQTVKTVEEEVKEERQSSSIDSQTKETQDEAKIAAVNEAVSIPDSALKRAIKRQLGIQRDEIYLSDLEGLTELEASYQNVKNLTGLEKATNLTKLEIAGNEIKTADALKDLSKLEYLDISYYQGTDIEFLTKLTNLKTLIITDTIIKNLDQLSGLSKLETLDISFSGITDLTPLAGLTSLKDVNISYLEKVSILPLKDLSLVTLTMYGEQYFHVLDEVLVLEKEGVEILHDDYFNVYFTSIKANENRAIFEWEYEGEEDVDVYQIKVGDTSINISADKDAFTVNDLADNTEYTVEIIAYNSVGELIGQAFETFQTLPTADGEKVVFNDAQLEKAVRDQFGLERDIVESDMKQIKELSLERKRIKDLTGLESATNLEYLYLSGNQISTISQLSSLNNLKSLYLDGNPISDFTPVSQLTNLISLGLGKTGVNDLSFLATLQSLEDLSLEGNELESLTTLPSLKNLAFLSVYDNKLTSLKGLENAEKLTALYADENPIATLEDLGDLPNITDLNLNYTLLTNIDRLADFASLDYVSLYGNGGLDLSEGSAAREVINILEQRGVYVDFEQAQEEEWFEVYVGSVTENSMQLFIDYYGAKEIATFEIFLNGKLYKTVPVDEPFLHLKELEANTEYAIEVHAYNAEKELLFSSTVTETTWDEPTGSVIPFKDPNLQELIKAELGLERDPVESDMLHLHSLYLFEENIIDLSGLEYADHLYEFYMYGNSEVIDLSPIAELQDLSYLYIEESPIKDYSVLKGMGNLQSLTIIHNKLEDLSFLEGMNKLSDITLQHNGIKNIAGFSALTKLNFISLANNQIEDITPLLASKKHLYSLDLTGNPIEDLSVLAQFENLFDLILDETKVTDLKPLLELYSLYFLSLYGVQLDTAAMQIVEELRQYGVQVNLEVDNTPELYIDEVTDNSISVSWDPMLPKEVGVYKVNLYSNYGEDLVEEVELPGSETSYQFTELDSNTDYYVEILVENEDYYGYLFAEVSTLATEGSFKDVSLYVYETEDEPEVDAMFDLYGIDPETEDHYFYGWSDEEGRLWDHSGEEAFDFFSLSAGTYEIMFVTVKGEEITFQFEIFADEEYMENPIFFVLNEEVDGQTPPETGPNDDEKEQGKEPSQPVKVNNPSQADKVEAEKTKRKAENEKNQKLPQTATITYNLLFIGMMILMFGGAILFIQKRKNIQ